MPENDEKRELFNLPPTSVLQGRIITNITFPKNKKAAHLSHILSLKGQAVSLRKSLKANEYFRDLLIIRFMDTLLKVTTKHDSKIIEIGNAEAY